MVIFISPRTSITLKCFIRALDQPIVASFPHFYARPGNFTDKLEGLHPDINKHTSYTIIEPVLGVPLHQRAVSQSNVVTKNLKSFKSDIAMFSNMVLPMFWIEFVRNIFSSLFKSFFIVYEILSAS